MPLQAVKLHISHNNVVGENTVLQLNISDTMFSQNKHRTQFVQNIIIVYYFSNIYSAAICNYTS